MRRVSDPAHLQGPLYEPLYVESVAEGDDTGVDGGWREGRIAHHCVQERQAELRETQRTQSADSR